MSLYLASLNSGSNGNCYYIGNEQDAVLIDAGLSCRETERRLTRCGLSVKNVRAVFISHEHSDHIRGVEVLSRKHKLPVYLSPVTYLSGLPEIEAGLLHTFSSHDEIQVHGLTVVPFSKQHDSSDPYSFTVSCKGITVGVFTDIGEPCTNVIHHFRQCHAAFLETNYDEIMLEEGNYPLHLKRRIRGSRGHLSNVQALELFTTHRAPFCKLLVLAHLSEHNNHPERVSSTFLPFSNGTRIEIASRYHESEVFCVTGD
jgi:phosphoribosyl 1,2-cyclic phosphodiesterase